MAITLGTLSPANETTNVDVNSTISFNISTDPSSGGAFDLDSLIILVNDVIPNYITITQNSDTNWDVLIEDLLFPSSSDSTRRYTLKVYIENAAGDKLQHVSYFDMETGIAIRSGYLSDLFLSYRTQFAANLLPEFSKARSERVSNFQLFLTPAGLHTQDMFHDLLEHDANHYIHTMNTEFPGIMNVHRVPTNTFEEYFVQNGEFDYIEPTVTGIDGVTLCSLSSPENNELYSLLKREVPDRLLATLSTSVFIDPLINSYTVDNIPITVFPNISQPGKLWVKISGASTFYTTINGADLQLGVKLKGKDEFDNDVEEIVLFASNKTRQTTRLFSELTEVSLTNRMDDNLTLTVYQLKPSQLQLLDLNFSTITPYYAGATRWSMSVSGGSTTLIESVNTSTNVVDELSGIDIIQPQYTCTLLDINGNEIALTDFVAHPFKEWIFGVDATKLYIFDKKRAMPNNLKDLGGQSLDPYHILEVDYEEKDLIPGIQIDISTRQLRFEKLATQSRFSVLYPDDTVHYFDVLGVETTATLAWYLNGNRTSNLYSVPKFSIPLNDYGTYIITMEVEYSDGTNDVQRRVVHIEGRQAKAQYILAAITDMTIASLTPKLAIDHNQTLKIIDGFNVYDIEQIFDKVVIDYEGSQLFTLTPYRGLRIE